MPVEIAKKPCYIVIYNHFIFHTHFYIKEEYFLHSFLSNAIKTLNIKYYNRDCFVHEFINHAIVLFNVQIDSRFPFHSFRYCCVMCSHFINLVLVVLSEDGNSWFRNNTDCSTEVFTLLRVNSNNICLVFHICHSSKYSILSLRVFS